MVHLKVIYFFPQKKKKSDLFQVDFLNLIGDLYQISNPNWILW